MARVLLPFRDGLDARSQQPVRATEAQAMLEAKRP